MIILTVKIVDRDGETFLTLRQEDIALEIDTGPNILVLTPLQAARLAGILDCWAEKGHLPEEDEVWA